MKIVIRKTLIDYAKSHPQASRSIHHWLSVAEAAEWNSTSDAIAAFSKAKTINAERVRFEIAGGDFRLIVAFYFPHKSAYIKFIGTHAEYDRVDAHTVDQF